MPRPLKELAWGLLIGLLGVLATFLPSVAALEEDWELAWLFHLRGPTRSPENVVVVAIDEESVRRLGLPAKPSLWSRDVHARLVDGLRRAGARVVCFDVTFDTPGPTRQADADFAAAIGRAGNVVLTDSLSGETGSATGGPERPASAFRIERLVPPIRDFEQVALAHAPFPLPREARVNAWWTFKSSAGDRPTLPVIAFEVFAFDAYRPFLDLLRKVAPQVQVVRPKSTGDLVSALGAGNINDTLWSAFHRDPTLRDRMSYELDRTSDRELPPPTKRRIRSILDLYGSDESAWLNFRGPPRTITTVPYYQALNAGSQDSRDRPAVDFAGKAVFVGFSASSQSGQDRIRDDYQTVFSEASGLYLSGVEIAATAFADLLDDHPIRPIAQPWRLALLLIWGAALGMACRLLRPGVAAALVAILAPAYLLLAVHQFSAANLWLPLVVPLCFLAPLSLARGLYLNYADAKRERERVRQIVSRFLPSHVVDELLEKVSSITSADRLVHGACLATDMEKYTSLAEEMPPTDLVRLMNEYFAELFKPVERLGGFVTNLTGDAMLAIWPSTSTHGSAGRQACMAALDIVDALKRFNQGASGRPAVQTRLGLHSGHMLLGTLGASRHYQYEAMGDMVNTASRIQGLGKHLGAQVLASEEAVDGLRDVLMRPIGSFLLAGKSAPVAVVELLGRQQEANTESLLLGRQFAAALDAYRTRRWLEAADMFSEILRRFPEDGPSRFYLQRCQACLLSSPDKSWDPIVKLDRK